MNRAILISMLLIGLMKQTWAATYYVAKTGSDANLCSNTEPCLTIAQGVSSATVPGDTVIVRAGA